MNILFIHQNFPGQFKFLAPALAKAGHTVLTLTPRKIEGKSWRGVRIVPYKIQRQSTVGIHPWVTDFESKIIRAEACFRAAIELRDGGFTPDVIIGHPGWGETLFLKDVWPQAKLGAYAEYFYRHQGSDVGFDPEFPSGREASRVRLMNTHHMLSFDAIDGAISPTKFQASTFPEPFRRKIMVIHDGIDTQVIAPDPQVEFALDDGTVLTRQDEVITFINRNLEPMRGFHVFMRALPEILKRRPAARVLVVGANGTGYGAAAPGKRSWKDHMLREVRGQASAADWARVRFLDRIPYDRFLTFLQVSTVHVYLTYPFVLSWSLMEAMSAECCVVASDTAPLHEVARDGDNARLVDFFDAAGLAGTVCELLDDPAQRRRLGKAAREFVQANYEINVCLPRQMAWVESLTLQAD